MSLQYVLLGTSVPYSYKKGTGVSPFCTHGAGKDGERFTEKAGSALTLLAPIKLQKARQKAGLSLPAPGPLRGQLLYWTFRDQTAMPCLKGKGRCLFSLTPVRDCSQSQKFLFCSWEQNAFRMRFLCPRLTTG
uniref:Uncharacterized protein n=1 Tax=Sphaerodactylus townsendi TaxID=933632 RepID=A0ACB8EXE1_9SAUR